MRHILYLLSGHFLTVVMLHAEIIILNSSHSCLLCLTVVLKNILDSLSISKDTPIVNYSLSVDPKLWSTLFLINMLLV